MSVNREHYDAVLNDLRANRNALAGNLSELNTVIDVLERFYNQPVKTLVQPVCPKTAAGGVLNSAPEITPSAPPVNLTATITKIISNDEFTLDATRAAENVSHGSFLVGLTETIDRAAAEACHDQIHLVKRVQELRPGTLTTSAQSLIVTLLRKNRLHKGEDLIIRPVANGKVVGLPNVSQDAVHSHGRYSQYQATQ